MLFGFLLSCQLLLGEPKIALGADSGSGPGSQRPASVILMSGRTALNKLSSQETRHPLGDLLWAGGGRPRILPSPESLGEKLLIAVKGT